MSHRRDRFIDVIENRHAVVEGEAQVRQMTIVHGWMRKMLDIAHRIVAGVAHGAAAKSWQTRQVRAMESGELFLQETKGVGVVQLFFGPRRRPRRRCLGRKKGLSGRVDLHMPIKRLIAQEWTRADEAVSPQALAANDTFKEERPVAFLNLAEGAHRGKRISD